jgi:hypothetical protein
MERRRGLRRPIALTLAAVAALVLACPPAGADDRIGVGGGGHTDPWAEVGVPGEAGSGGSTRGSGSVICLLYDVPSIETPYEVGIQPVRDPAPGGTYVLICTNAAGEEIRNEIIVYQPGVTVVDAAALAAYAYRDLPLGLPSVSLSPPADADQLVGIATWLWVDAGPWSARRATASVPGLSATVIATPDRLVWRPGDGNEVVCPGPGVPYDPARPADGQRTDCSHTYQRSSGREPGGRFTAEVQLVWRVTWESSNGRRGSLPDAWRGVRVPVRVVERQAAVL